MPLHRIRKEFVQPEAKTSERVLHQQKARQHAKRANSDGTVTREAWAAMQAFCNNECIVPYCTAPGDTQDHVVPVSEGGLHSIFNLQPMCVSHNSAKGTKTKDYRPSDWPW